MQTAMQAQRVSRQCRHHQNFSIQKPQGKKRESRQDTTGTASCTLRLRLAPPGERLLATEHAASACPSITCDQTEKGEKTFGQGQCSSAYDAERPKGILGKNRVVGRERREGRSWGAAAASWQGIWSAGHVRSRTMLARLSVDALRCSWKLRGYSSALLSAPLSPPGEASEGRTPGPPPVRCSGEGPCMGASMRNLSPRALILCS